GARGSRGGWVGLTSGAVHVIRPSSARALASATIFPVPGGGRSARHRERAPARLHRLGHLAGGHLGRLPGLAGLLPDSVARVEPPQRARPPPVHPAHHPPPPPYPHP